MKITRAVSLLVLSALLASCSAQKSTETYPVLTAIGENTTRTDTLYEEKTDEYPIEKDAVYGIRFTSADDFSGIALSGYTKKTDDAKVAIHFYDWLGSYEQTVSAEAKEKGSLHFTNENLSVQFSFINSDFPAGEYLVTFKTSADDVCLDFGEGIEGNESFKNGTAIPETICVGLIKTK